MSPNLGIRRIDLPPPHRLFPALAFTLVLAVTAAGCSGTSGTSGVATRHSGPVDVLYAGSLVDLMQQEVGPEFTAATGYTVNGYSGGSDALATDIKGGTQQADVFISAARQPNTRLEGAANGNWVSWFAEFATSPLVLGYYPQSKFAGALKSAPWYNVVSRPGFMVGRTDPVTDPKGVLAVDALTSAATRYHQPALEAIAMSSRDIFAESAMVGELQAGQIDAGFFYAVEAAAGHIPTVPLTGTHLAGAYTITILNRAPHSSAAQAFVSFLLSRQGQKLLEHNGLVPVRPPSVSGPKSAIPPRLQAAF